MPFADGWAPAIQMKWKTHPRLFLCGRYGLHGRRHRCTSFHAPTRPTSATQSTDRGAARCNSGIQAAASSWLPTDERQFLVDQAAVFQNVADAIEPPPSKIFGE
jgi:hypothetical protein